MLPSNASTSRSKRVRGIISSSSDANRYKKITDYGQKLGLDFQNPATASGGASAAVRREGRAGGERSPDRSRKLMNSLANRTSTSSRKRAIQRILSSQYGVRSS